MPSHDYEEFIAALNAHGVRYLVIGVHAVHTADRRTLVFTDSVDPHCMK